MDGREEMNMSAVGAAPRKRGRGNSGLTPALVNALLKQGMSPKEIAQDYGVTEQAVSNHKARGGDGGATFKSPRDEAMEFFPWPNMEPSFKTSSLYWRLTDHLVFVVCGVRHLPMARRARLRSFYEKLIKTNTVAVFDPGIPAKPGSTTGGWDFVPRGDGDGDLIIRVNDHVIADNGCVGLDDTHHAVWRVPGEDVRRELNN